jgi:integrase/recombinase XerC
MFAAIDGFLRYLKIERNASELTIKSYSEDFGSLQDYIRDRVGEVSTPAELQIAQLRGYVAYLHECDYARTTIARRLASLRSFFRSGHIEPDQGLAHAASWSQVASFFDH